MDIMTHSRVMQHYVINKNCFVVPAVSLAVLCVADTEKTVGVEFISVYDIFKKVCCVSRNAYNSVSVIIGIENVIAFEGFVLKASYVVGIP